MSIGCSKYYKIEKKNLNIILKVNVLVVREVTIKENLVKEAIISLYYNIKTTRICDWHTRFLKISI